ncbi:MAG: YueI family protein [Tetragenococcus halophilus]|nr:YueI family protein [Tetragenococcus halophilus]MDN6567277.1 YueI family protein [Tetragenococcus halophilus]MDN6725872.1 YueI family protein [Tetragenococcus halophilus]
MTDEVQKHLDKGMYGTPSVNPDEQKKFLGTFRERVYVRMSIQQMKETENKKILEKHLTDYPNANVLINGNINESLQSSYIQMIMKANLKFTVVDTDLKEDTDSGLLVISDEAVNADTIDIQEKFTFDNTQAPQEKQEKKSFWHKLFHNN